MFDRLESRILQAPYILFVEDVRGLMRHGIGLNIEVNYHTGEILGVANPDNATRFPTDAALKAFFYNQIMIAGVVLFSPDDPNNEYTNGVSKIVLGMPQDWTSDLRDTIYENLKRNRPDFMDE